MNLREIDRKERAVWEVSRTVMRYENECGKCHTYKVDPKELENYYHAKELKEV